MFSSSSFFSLASLGYLASTVLIGYISYLVIRKDGHGNKTKDKILGNDEGKDKEKGDKPPIPPRPKSHSVDDPSHPTATVSPLPSPPSPLPALFPTTSHSHLDEIEEKRIQTQLQQATMKIQKEGKEGTDEKDKGHNRIDSNLTPPSPLYHSSSSPSPSAGHPSTPVHPNPIHHHVTPSSSPLDEDAKRSAHRQQICEEIVASEHKYVNNLTIVVSQFLLPMKVKSKDLKLSPSDLSQIFSNIESILSFHKTFADELNNYTKNSSFTIGKTFIKYWAFMKAYIEYINGYDVAIETMRRLMENNSAFKKFLKKGINVKETQGMELMSYLIQPIQRVPRYQLLIQELLKYTPNSHVEYIDLSMALDKIKSLATQINEKKREHEHLSIMLDFQNKISNLPEGFALFAPARKLIRYSPMTLKSSQKDSQAIFILFNDILLWVNEQFEYLGHVKLSDVVIQNVKELSNTLEIYNENNNNTTNPSNAPTTTWKRSLIIQCHDKHEHLSWLSSLIESRDQAVKNIRANENEPNAGGHKRAATTTGLIQEALRDIINKKNNPK